MTTHDRQTQARLTRAAHDELTQDAKPLLCTPEDFDRAWDDQEISLTALWLSTLNFHLRFDHFPPDLPSAIDVVHEEFNEFLAEAIRRPKTTDDKQNLVDETVDLIVTVMGVLMASQIPLSELHNSIQRVIKKNNAKTRETHIINAAGKIARRKEKTNE